jgi:teichuronic acid biosynthesis glycosyltransferase TuaG
MGKDSFYPLLKVAFTNLLIYIKNETNRGVSYNRNLGIQKARSQWIMFLDADDTFHPKKIEIIRYCIQKYGSFNAIGHGFNLQSDPVYVPADSWKDSGTLQTVTTKDILIKSRMVTPSLTVSAKNKILFNEKMIHAEDHDFILRTSESFSIGYLNMPLCSLNRMPLTEGGLSSNKWKMRVGEIRMYVSYCKRNNRAIAIPIFILFSLLKHIKGLLGL